MAMLRLPGGAAVVASNVRIERRHAGLQLDRLSPPVARQEEQRPLLDEVIRASGDPSILEALIDRRRRVLEKLEATCWTIRTAGALTLHLARRGALENVGLALHPLYGFAFLPGSGLKGLAHAWATTIWKGSQRDENEADRRIKRIFGSAPDSSVKASDASARAAAAEKRDGDQGNAGAVVFHDAWPRTWPRLVIDTTTSHHPKYYESGAPPGDWEDPRPVSFLAIPTAQEFSCALSANRRKPDREAVALAREWLTHALAWLGAGAKTNAGYGTLVPTAEESSAAPQTNRAVHDNVLKLVTPAFLAGADQKSHDCDLRPATLRGLLRQWWRTRHAGFVEVSTLRMLESAVWGDTTTGGALRVTVTPLSPVTPILFDHKDGSRPKREFREAHDLQDPGRNTTQGIFYLAYGMDDGGKRRTYLESGATWRIRLVARPTSADSGAVLLSAEQVLTEGLAALWLLCHFGGVGAKNRKGYGSLALGEPIDGMSLESVRNSAAGLRSHFGVGYISPILADSFSLEKMDTFDVSTPWTNVWFVLDQLGEAVQGFARQNKHKARKQALGLPRRIHGPRQTNTPPPEELFVTIGAQRVKRHASPVFCHVDVSSTGRLTIRVSTFTAKHLPNAVESMAVLKDFRAFVQSDLTSRVVTHASRGTKTVRGTPSPPSHAATAKPPVKSGAIERCRLLEERTSKGGWKAEHIESGLSGHIINTAEVPADKKPGDTVSLKIASVSANRKTLVFQWMK